MDTHYHDLEDVIAWASHQEWYQEPFCLAGHSLGGFSNLIYATNYPDKVKAFAPTAACISYAHSEECHIKNDPDQWVRMKDGELKEKTSKSKPGAVGLVSFKLYESFKNYDVLSKLDKIIFPTLLIVGENDDSCPPEHQKIIFDEVNGDKELHVIEDCGHTFRKPEHLRQVKEIFDRWIDKL